MPTYVITGARAGIGLGYVRQLSTSSDNTVVAVVRDITGDLTDLNNVISSGKAKVHVVEGNLASPESLASLPSRLPEGLKINVLIQNAAILLDSTRSDKPSTVSVEALNVHFTTNVIGPAMLFQALVPFLAPGAIVANISSGVGSMGWLWGGTVVTQYPAYSISKAALNMLTVHQASELKGKAIVVAVDPGWVKTKMGSVGAIMEVADSASTVLRTLSMLKEEDSGKLMCNDGTPQPW